MGVAELWHLLNPIRERKTLWELQNKTVAVDLSCWVCDTKNIQEFCPQKRLYLRNLFFRTSCLLLMGVKPVFVLEGQAPAIKKYTMARRVANIHGHTKGEASQQSQRRRSGKRSHFQGVLKHCEELLTIMGLTCIRSKGEAEAMCAHLNEIGLVDGCVSQDGDCFLYGAQIVYRNFTISPSGTDGSAGFSVDVYNLNEAKQKLQLGREKLIALALLCGCDYTPGGIRGIGRQAVVNFLDQVPDTGLISRIQGWRADPCLARFDAAHEAVTSGAECARCGHSGRQQRHEKSGCPKCPGAPSIGCVQDPDRLPLTDRIFVSELLLRKKAVADPYFPSEAVLDEYLQENQAKSSLPIDTSWRQPDLIKFIKYTGKLLKWSECYAIEKFMPLVTRWHLVHLSEGKIKKIEATKGFLKISPKIITKKRIVKGICSYEILWNDEEGFMNTIEMDDGITIDKLLTTVEPQHLVQTAYPEVVQEFLAEKEKSKKGKEKTKRKQKPSVKTVSVPCLCESKENGGCQHVNDKACQRKNATKKTVVEGYHNIEKFFSRLSISTVDNLETDINSGVSAEQYKRALTPTYQSTPKRASNKTDLRMKVLKKGIQSLVKSECTQKYKSSEESESSSLLCNCSILSDECDMCKVSGDEDMDLTSIIEDIVGRKCSPDNTVDLKQEELANNDNEDEYVPLYERLKLKLQCDLVKLSDIV
ncbi:flap endonuclease GEN [Schistocerca piceifrons]|uniref:flap endonuclease GEN n=1 Tax=Schistocerca piceifrons TaxID=274613 RepID=UPI001F5FEC53|nr:flap endonuclease GEN [Schistocerca piceifrons]